MCRNFTVIILFQLFVFVSCVQGFSQAENSENKLSFYIGEQVTNATDVNEKQIIELWKSYLLAGKYGEESSPYWSFDNVNVPDEYLWAVGVDKIQEKPYKTQCKIIGVFKAEKGYYCLKSAFTHINEQGEIFLDVVPTVYAKKFGEKFLLVDSMTYHKEILEYHKIGNINYYVHPFHKFDIEKARLMNATSNEFAQKFEVEPLEFDYFVANTSREITEVWGYEYMDRMYRPEQSGGVAIVSNNVVLSGNNSEYYAHEVFHLYAFNVNKNIPYFMINEGIATFFAGSSERTFEWHLQELKDFNKLNPNYDYNKISDLVDFDIPNGKHMTDLRYIVGAVIIKEVYRKYGIQGIKDALSYGHELTDLHVLLKEKLNVKPEQFNLFIKKQLEN